MHWWPVAVIIVLQLSGKNRAEECPYPCVCYFNQDPDRTLTVDCRGQELFEIPLGIPPTTSHLDVSSNSIQFIRAVDLMNLPVLTFLQLHTNEIMQIEDGAFQELTSLEGVYLHNNQLSVLRSGTFNGLSNLLTLSLYNNYIEELEPGVFDPLNNIVNLDLSYNSLESIMAGTFSNLSRLFHLDLSENFISVIEERAFSNLPFLRSLNLAGNQLQTVPMDAWVNVPFLFLLSLDRNPLECGCGAIWLRQWLLNRGIRGPVFCESPPNLQGMDLLTLTPADFCQLPTVDVVQSDPVVLVEGMTLQLECSATGAPPPTVMWSREGMTFDPMYTRLQLMGNSLTVNNVTVNDTGRYFCCATSSAGTAAGSVDVAVVTESTAVMNDSVVTNESVVPVAIATVGDTVTLECYDGLPPTASIRWFFNSTLLNLTERYTLGERGELVIFDVQAEDMGRFMCEVEERVMLSRDLVLQATPIITISPEGPCETPTLYFFTTADSVRLLCEASGVPIPTVVWTTANRGNISGSGSATLELVPPSLEDAGLYSCIATNEIGVDARAIEITVMAVLTPGMSFFRSLELLLGQTAILNCSVGENITTLSVTWQRADRLPLPERSVQTGDGTLIIPDVELTDIALYQCRAQTQVGVAEIEYGVAIFDPPQIIELCPQPEVTRAITGSSITLNCSVTGRPIPMLEWMFGNVTIQTGERYSITNRGRNLIISMVMRSDAGVYTCSATNRVGMDEYSYRLEVEPGLFFRHQPSGRLDFTSGDTARVPCQGDGDPPPLPTWFMTPLESSSPVTQVLPSQRIVISPEELVIFDVMVSDEGFYFCAIGNGEGRRESTMVHFSVWVPPRLADSLPREYLAVEGTSSVVMACNGTGDPEPELTWIRDNSILPFSNNEQRIRPDGSLEIFRVAPEDEGVYMCRLANAAGEVYLTVNLIVRAAPRTTIIPTDPGTLNVGNQLTLFCSNMGEPPSELEWLIWSRDGDRLVTGGNIVVMDNGELILSNLQISDSGNYTCEISSYAGSSEASIMLQVEDPLLSSGAMILPPSVTTPTPLSQTVAEGQTAQFACVAMGFPLPTILWQKNGQRVPNLDRITIRGGLLTIRDVRVTDEAMYTCFASNQIMMVDTLIFNLSVASRPIITWPPQPQVLSVGEAIVLRCKAFGDPEPNILWLHNDTQLVPGGCVIINETTNTLQICNTTLSSAGSYSCIAMNTAGITEYSVPVTILETPPSPPNITTSPESMIVAAGEPLILDCIAGGNPPPSITWFKDGVPVVTTCPTSEPANCTLLDNVSVYIQVTTVADSGTYTCVTENSAGVSTYEVHVLVEPETTLPMFTVFPRIVTQTDEFVEVECVAEGNPPPVLSWLDPNFMVISSSNTERIFTANGTLFINNALSSDSGQYFCRAENTAGVNQACILLWIGEEEGGPGNETNGNGTLARTEGDQGEGPKFLVAPRNASTFAGLSLRVPCTAVEEDDTFILWRRNGQLVYPDDAVTIAKDGTLIIQRAKVEHTGEYVCMAVNGKGIATATIYISVETRAEPPLFLSYPVDLQVASGSDFSLPCTAVSLSGDVTITSWLYNGDMLQQSCGRYDILPDGSLQVMNAQTNDSGLYTCHATNQYGSMDAMATVTVTYYPVNHTFSVQQGNPHQLECTLDMGGSPEGALVMWMMGDEPLRPSNAIIPFESSLWFLAVSVDLEGEYTCKVKDQLLNFFVDVLVPPAVVNTSSMVQVTANSTARVDCAATGKPRPEITWHRDGVQLTHNAHYSLLHNGTLLLHPSLTQLTGRYDCLATNTAGQDQTAILVVMGT